MLQIGRYFRRGTGAMVVTGPLGVALVPQDWAEESRQALAGRIELVPWLTRLSQSGIDAAVLDLAGPHALLSLFGEAQVQALAPGVPEALDWSAPLWGWVLNPGDWECLDVRLSSEAEDADVPLELVTEDVLGASTLRIGRPLRDETARFEPPAELEGVPVGDRQEALLSVEGVPVGDRQEALLSVEGVPVGDRQEAEPAPAVEEASTSDQSGDAPPDARRSGPRHLWVPDPTRPSGIRVRDRVRSAGKPRHLWVPEEHAEPEEVAPSAAPDVAGEVPAPVGGRDQNAAPGAVQGVAPGAAGEVPAPVGGGGEAAPTGPDVGAESLAEWVWAAVGDGAAETSSAAPSTPSEGETPSSRQTDAPEFPAVQWGEELFPMMAGAPALGNPEVFEKTMTPEALHRMQDEQIAAGRTVLRRIPETHTAPTAFLVYAGSSPIEVVRDVVIGREPDTRILTGRPLASALRVPSPNVEISRSHCAVTATGPGVWSLMDLGSANGTVLVHPDGTSEEVTAMLAMALVDGDRIDLGEGVTVEFRVR